MLKRLRADILRKIYFAKYNFSPFRFSMAASHLKGRLVSIFSRSRKFRIIDLAVTYKCNLDCDHCSALIMDSHKPVLDLDNYRSIVREAEKLDNLSWNITGGEPLLVDWLDDLIPLLKPKKHYISIQTNCILLTEKRARQLAELGVNCITTSIDSINPDEHNAFRRMEKAYQMTFEGLSNARKAGMQILIAGVVTHKNLRTPELRQLIERANQAGAIFLFNLAVPCGKWRDNHDIILRGDDRDYLKYLLQQYPKSTTDHEVGRNAVGCPAGKEKIYITPFGDVTPCPFIHVSFGNVKEQPLGEIVEQMRKISFFNEYSDVCIAAEDKEFQQKVIHKVHEFKPPYPISHSDIFGEDSEC